MHGTADDLEPVIEMEDASARSADWGGMACGINRVAPGTDMSPVLEALPHGECQVPHWGYVIEGSWTIGYNDGTRETIGAGEVFHLPAGHNHVSSEEGALIAEFSPSEEMAAVMAEIHKVIGAA